MYGKNLVAGLGVVGVVAQKSWRAPEDKDTLNATRPVVTCSDHKPDRLVYGKEQAFNFTEVYAEEDDTGTGGYNFPLSWAKDRVIGEPSASLQGKRVAEDLIWQCLKKCLGMNYCSSFIVTQSRQTDYDMGLTHCYFFSEPLKMMYLEQQDSLEDVRVIRAYSIVCPSNIRDLYAEAKKGGRVGSSGEPLGNSPETFGEDGVRDGAPRNDNDEAQHREVEDVRGQQQRQGEEEEDEDEDEEEDLESQG